jgi:hypothetical protein
VLNNLVVLRVLRLDGNCCRGAYQHHDPGAYRVFEGLVHRQEAQGVAISGVVMGTVVAGLLLHLSCSSSSSEESARPHAGQGQSHMAIPAGKHRVR